MFGGFLVMEKIYEGTDEYGDSFYCRNICLKLKCISYDDNILKNIEKDILEVLNDKSFDGLCDFRRIGE